MKRNNKSLPGGESCYLHHQAALRKDEVVTTPHEDGRPSLNEGMHDAYVRACTHQCQKEKNKERRTRVLVWSLVMLTVTRRKDPQVIKTTRTFLYVNVNLCRFKGAVRGSLTPTTRTNLSGRQALQS